MSCGFKLSDCNFSIIEFPKLFRKLKIYSKVSSKIKVNTIATFISFKNRFQIYCVKTQLDHGSTYRPGASSRSGKLKLNVYEGRSSELVKAILFTEKIISPSFRFALHYVVYLYKGVLFLAFTNTNIKTLYCNIKKIGVR